LLPVGALPPNPLSFGPDINYFKRNLFCLEEKAFHPANEMISLLTDKARPSKTAYS